MARRDAFWPDDRAEIIVNRVRCSRCGTVLTSRSEYEDVQWCDCGLVGIRGGCEDLVRIGELSCVEELSVELLTDGTQQPVMSRTYGGDDAAGDGGGDTRGQCPPEVAEFFAAANGDEWKALSDMKRNTFRRRRSWEKYPSWVELVVEYPDLEHMSSFNSRTGDGLILLKQCFYDVSEAIVFARHKRRTTAMSRLNYDGKLGDHVCMYLKTVDFVPYMHAGLLDDDLTEVICPKCGHKTNSYAFDGELKLCNSCVTTRHREIVEKCGARYQKPYERHKGTVGEFLKDYGADCKPKRDW